MADDQLITPHPTPPSIRVTFAGSSPGGSHRVVKYPQCRSWGAAAAGADEEELSLRVTSPEELQLPSWPGSSPRVPLTPAGAVTEAG